MAKLCLASLCLSFYFFVWVCIFGLRFPHTGLGVWKRKSLWKLTRESLSIVLNNMNGVVR